MKKIKFKELGKHLNGQCKCDICGLVCWSCMSYKGDDDKRYCSECKEKTEKAEENILKDI